VRVGVNERHHPAPKYPWLLELMERPHERGNAGQFRVQRRTLAGRGKVHHQQVLMSTTENKTLDHF
jgi:hypothetical protein